MTSIIAHYSTVFNCEHVTAILIERRYGLLFRRDDAEPDQCFPNVFGRETLCTTHADLSGYELSAEALWSSRAT